MRHRRLRGLAGACAAVVLALAGFAACVGDHSRAGAKRETFELTRERALFWEVAKQGEERVRLYLLGSIHVLDVPVALGPGIERAFRDSDVLVVEIDLRSAREDDFSELLIRYGALDAGERLGDVVTADTLERLDAYCVEQALPQQVADGLHRMRPWAIAMMIEMLQYERVGLRADYGVDVHFLGLAGAKPVVGLETIDEQMYALSSHSDRTQEELLRLALDTPAAPAVGPLALVEAWKEGDARALEQLIFPSDPGEAGGPYDELYETVFFARNAQMADSLQELLEEGEDDLVYFAVIGAAHLVGENSIQAMLADAGYTSTR